VAQCLPDDDDRQETTAMKITTIFGSPRAKGNTAKVLAWVEEQLQADGHAVDRANMVDYDVDGCIECYACKGGDADLCAVEDDANGLLQRMLDADLVIMAAPLFCWGFPAQLKTLVDRMFCLTDEPAEDGSYISRVEGKPFALLVTAAGPIKDNADMLAKVFDALVEYALGSNAGHLLVPLCTTPEAIGDDTKAAAVAFAQEITA